MILILIGLLTGIISGMGIGGGTILIPFLIFLTGTSQHTAQSINLAVFLPTAIVAICVHTKNRHIKYSKALQIFAAGCIGAIAGSAIAVSIPSEILRRIFGVFLFIMGLYEFFRKDKKKSNTK